jgi:diguanylate cyclase
VNSADSSETVHRLASETLSLLRQHRILETPPNYELFYMYLSGGNEELETAVNEIVRTGGGFSAAQIEALRRQFLAGRYDAQTLNDTNISLQSAIETVLSVVNEAGGDTVRFGDTIELLSDQLNARQSEDHVKTVLNKIVGETHAMTARTRQLESNLDVASTEIKALRENLERTRRAALTDDLTGLGNRKCFDDELRKAMEIALKDGEPLCVAMGDVDHFKKFNDTWGHQLGDQVLKLVSHYFKANLKGQDTAARYGGEEFAIILPKTRLSSATLVADHVRRAVCAKKMKKRTTGETIGYVTISMGVAQFRPGESLAALMARADGALYAAKDAGRNRVISETDADTMASREDMGTVMPFEARA